jgi:hypothetical protein
VISMDVSKSPGRVNVAIRLGDPPTPAPVPVTPAPVPPTPTHLVLLNAFFCKNAI